MHLKSKKLISVPFLILALGLISCSDNSKNTKVITPWEVAPPYFKVYDNQTDEAKKSESLNRLDLNTTNLKLSTTDELIFEDAEKNPGSILSAETLCSNSENVAFKQTFRLTLLNANSVYRFLPEEILLLPTDQLASFQCAVRFVAQKPNGSTHDFGESIHFSLVSENIELLLPLEDETLVSETSVWAHVDLIQLSRARYHHLPAKNINDVYRLKCSDFDSSSKNARQLFDLVETSLSRQNLQSDQLCRVLIQDSQGLLKTSKLFVLRLFDTKNYIEAVEKTTGLTPEMLDKHTMEYTFNNIKLHNRTKYPMFFSSQNASFKVAMSARGNYHESVGQGRLIFIREAALPSSQIRQLGHQTVFVLMPNQRATVTYEVRTQSLLHHISVSWHNKSPSLDILQKKSLDDEEASILTSLPFMENQTVEFFYAPKRKFP